MLHIKLSIVLYPLLHSRASNHGYVWNGRINMSGRDLVHLNK
jgi:hypothetical protein